MIAELGIGVFSVAFASYALWVLHRRKSMLRGHVLRQRKVRRYTEEG